MLQLTFDKPKRRRLRILALGAHCDDIDIGCGATMLALLERHPGAEVTWVAFASSGEREREFRASAKRFLARAGRVRMLVHTFRDGFFPAQYTNIKEVFESLKAVPDPDLVFTHHAPDWHQDHRLICQLTWNTFRNHLILEYEVPKYEGDLSTPNAYVSVSRAQAERKISILWSCYRTQRAKQWFTADTFRGLMRLRGIEGGGATGWAEGFHVRKFGVG